MTDRVIEALSGFRTKIFRSTITRPANTNAYTAGYVISDTTANAHCTFGSTVGTGQPKRVGRPNRMSGVINAARLYSSQNNTSAKLDAELWLFRADIVAVADNAAIAFTDTEVLTCIGVIQLSSANWFAGLATSGAGGNSFCQVNNIDLPFISADNGLLYGQLVARNAYVPVTSEVFVVDLVITQD